MEFPEPVIELAIEPKTKAGQGKMGEALAKLAEEDPTFRAHTDQETGQTIIAGMGELHLDIIVDRLLREFKVEANVGAPQVAYKETITKAVDVDSKYAKQSGGRGQYGHCKVKFEPMDANGEELYKTCQVVSLHIPATAETKNSINYALLKDMPKGAMLVNTARKEVINEAELIKLMEDRADFKYITDIMPAANAEFAEKFAGRYFSTPKKMGAQTAEANINAGIAAAQQIVGFLKDGCEKFRVNK